MPCATFRTSACLLGGEYPPQRMEEINRRYPLLSRLLSLIVPGRGRQEGCELEGSGRHRLYSPPLAVASPAGVVRGIAVQRASLRTGREIPQQFGSQSVLGVVLLQVPSDSLCEQLARKGGGLLICSRMEAPRAPQAVLQPLQLLVACRPVRLPACSRSEVRESHWSQSSTTS